MPRKGNVAFLIGVAGVVTLLLLLVVSGVAQAQYQAEVDKAIDTLNLKQQEPEPGVGVGVYTWDTPYDEFIGVDDFQLRVGHDLEYVLWFQAMGDHDANFQEHAVNEAVLRGLVPIISLEPWLRNFDERSNPQPEYSFQRVAAGNFDGYFRLWARRAAESAAPMYVRFGQDPSVLGAAHWYPWQDDTPENYIGAFRRMVGIFREEGATNVKFIWSSNNLGVESQWDYYPGDEYVDAIATTTLNFGSWGTWQSFAELFDPQYAEIRERAEDMPIFIIQLASAEDGGDKAVWLTTTFNQIETSYEGIQAVIFWEVPSDWQYADLNWAVNSSPAAATAAVESLAP